MSRLTAKLLLCVCLTLATLTVTATQAQVIPHAQDRPPGPALSPAEALKKMKVPEGFSVELVAAEPDLVNPVAMTFDERGRIWVTESFEYPRTEAGPGRDRVKVLEDTDNDGQVDKVTVFAEGLNIPSGIAVGAGGVWVANAPDILFLQDTDGDGKADKQEVVVTGFGRTDTHELPNSLTWGPDGWLYGLNGVFNYSHVKHKGKEYKFTCALFRIHPRTRDFELFCEGTSNPWGVAFDAEGSAFISACVIDHLWHLTETGYYHRQGGPYPPFTWKIESIVKHKHQKAAYCGIHYFDSDAYPAEYRDKLYMGNIHGNCLNVDSIQRRGSTYAGTGEPDFLSANDAWFMPVAQKTGPDGCLYVLDWYDQYHCYQDARRDPAGIERAKGRLYRIRYKDSPRATPFDLAKEADEQLIQRLHSPNVFYRDLAQRLLRERNTPEICTRLNALVLNDATPKKTRLHALWSLLNFSRSEPAGTPLDEAFLTRLLQHEDSTFRAWGVRAAGEMGDVPPAIRQTLIEMALDKAPDVQLQVAIAAGKIHDMPQMPVLLKVLAACGDDPLIPHIVWQNLHPLLEEQSPQFVAAVKDVDLEHAPQFAVLMPRVIERMLGRKTFEAASISAFIEHLANTRGSVDAAGNSLAFLASRIQSGEIQGEHLAQLKAAMEPLIAPWVKASTTHPLGFQAGLLSVTWKDPAAVEAIRRSFATNGLDPSVRLRSLEALIAAGDAKLLDVVAEILGKLSTPSTPRATLTPAEFRGQLLAALGRMDDPRVAEVVLASYKTLEPELQPRAIELLTQRVGWSKRLLAGIGKKEVAADALNLNQVRKLLATKDPELAKLVAAQWGKIRDERNPQREQVIASMRTLIRQTPGDASKGREVFKKLCGQCHKIYGEGQEVGPDITVNGRNSFEQLLSNVFDPSLVIGAAFQARTVSTNGRTLTGLVIEDSDQRLVLKVQGGKEEVIPRDQIEEMKQSSLSLMPEDLEKTLKPQEIADLFAFITLDRPPEDPQARQLPGVREVVPRQTSVPEQFADILGEVAPGFTATASGEGGVALLKEHRGRPTVVRTHPVSMTEACVLRSTVTLPADKKSYLELAVSHEAPKGNQDCDWRLIVRANGERLYDEIVESKLTKNGWADIRLDLSKFAGKQVKLELSNGPTGWFYEFGYWGRAEIRSE